ncbi:MAG: GNAT family N-acetyltransferase [Hymenobacteraceae bacterium]|mgnify:CR=1 FL=1|nr:GNAT family N-acetyltransferase [Hymenobacteraceae bacterium]MDX5480566.1 GNAT family N-acetyltransferase [Hymenobacteraceae bacterium]
MNALYNVLPDSFEEQLETENLLLRPYREGDENDFMRLLQESASSLSPTFSERLARVRMLEDARVQVRQLRTAWDNRRMFDFGVWLKKEEKYIGDVTLKNLNHRIPKAEIGLYFTNWPETRSYALEALQKVVSFAFDTLHLNKVYIRCCASSVFYGELAQDCGFRQEGLLRSDHRGVDADGLLDVMYYGMTRQDYELSQDEAKKGSATSVA